MPSYNDARCVPMVSDGFDPWFAEDDPEQVEFACHVCNACPEQANCLLHGLVNNEPYGVFGGLDPAARAEIMPTFLGLPKKTLAALQKTYSIETTPYTPSVQAKYRRRFERAQFCLDRLIEQGWDIPNYDLFFEVCEAVVNEPTETGESLGRRMGKSPAMFNQRLRECFEYFGCDLSVL
jgi:hypothetical protein